MLGLGGLGPVVGKQPWEVGPLTGATPAAADGGAAASSGGQSSPGGGQWYEAPFDSRAVSLLEDAMGKGFVPSIRGVDEGPFTVDLREMPPTVSEVTVLAVLAALERRAVKTGRCKVFHSVTFLVPPFDPDYIMWPSYVDKLSRHYNLRVRWGGRMHSCTLCIRQKMAKGDDGRFCVMPSAHTMDQSLDQ